MGCFPFFVFLFTNGNWETGRFSFLFFSFQNENPLAAKYTDLQPYTRNNVSPWLKWCYTFKIYKTDMAKQATFSARTL